MLRTIKWLRNLAAAVGAWWLIVTFTPVDFWWAQWLARPWASCEGDALLVLAGDSLPDGVLGSSSYWRSVYTVRTMRDHAFRQVLISGGGAGDGRRTSETMRDFVRGSGIDTSHVAVETASTSTLENARRAVEMLTAPAGKVVLLTSDYHVRRAFRVFRKAGLEVAPCPVPDVLKRYSVWYGRAGLFFELAIETGKLGWYEWKGWI